MIIDAHVHLDENLPGSAGAAAGALNCALAEAGVARAVVLHLETQRWTVEEVAAALAENDRLVGFINVHPFSVDAERRLEWGVAELGFGGLKLHPRLQNYAMDDPRTHRLVGLAGELGVPVLVDAFPDGDWLMQGFHPLSFAKLARQNPKTRIIAAHMGGHHALDMMMLAKRLPNLYFDLSFSLLYYRGSSVTADLLYVMRSMKFERIFYGSDHPDRSIAETLSQTLELLQIGGLEQAEIDKIMYQNAREFFGWSDL